MSPNQLSFLRLFAPRMLPKMSRNGKKGKIALHKKETFEVLKGTQFVWKRILLSYKLNMCLKSLINLSVQMKLCIGLNKYVC